jgi:hypothetical protein
MIKAVVFRVVIFDEHFFTSDAYARFGCSFPLQGPGILRGVLRLDDDAFDELVHILCCLEKHLIVTAEGEKNGPQNRLGGLDKTVYIGQRGHNILERI